MKARPLCPRTLLTYGWKSLQKKGMRAEYSAVSILIFKIKGRVLGYFSLKSFSIFSDFYKVGVCFFDSGE